MVYLWFIHGLSMVYPWIDDDWVMMIGSELHRGPDGASPGNKTRGTTMFVATKNWGNHMEICQICPYCFCGDISHKL